MKVKILCLMAVLLLLLFGCSQQKTTPHPSSKLGELYVSTISDASNWNSKPSFLAITEDSFSDVGVTTKEWVLTKLNEKYEEVYIFEEVKDDEDKFEYESVNGRETLVRVFDGMIIDVEMEQYEGNIATIRVSAKKALDVGVIPIYEASYKDGKWTIEKKVQAEV